MKEAEGGGLDKSSRGTSFEEEGEGIEEEEEEEGEDEEDWLMVCTDGAQRKS